MLCNFMSQTAFYVEMDIRSPHAEDVDTSLVNYSKYNSHSPV